MNPGSRRGSLHTGSAGNPLHPWWDPAPLWPCRHPPGTPHPASTCKMPWVRSCVFSCWLFFFFLFFSLLRTCLCFAEIRKLGSWVCYSPSPPVSGSCSEHSRWRVGGGCLLTFPSGMGPNFLNFGKVTRGKRDALILVIWKVGIRKTRVFGGVCF